MNAMEKFEKRAAITVAISLLLAFSASANLAARPAESSGTLTIAQQKTIKVRGIVTDTNTGEPIIGVNVAVDGNTRIGTITDVNGNFTLEVPEGAKLLVSYIGYLSQTVLVTGATLNISLKEDSQMLNEIVVVGYGTQRRESLTSSLQTLDNKKLTTTTSPSVENMLSGKAPGVFVAPSGGEPGSVGKVIIRGKSSINGNTNPLWVIDGVIVGNASNYSLNPSDIETMSILKDAASTAIYGSQGANGVIVVTTKRAKAGKIEVNVSLKAGFSKLNNGNMEVMDGAELYDYYASFSNQGEISFPRWNADLRNSNYNWWDLATRTGITQDYNVSLSGGNEILRSYFSAGYYDETGAIRGRDFHSYSVRYRSEYKPAKWLTVKPMISGSRRDIDDRQYSVTAMYSNLPWDSPYLEDGTPTPHRSNTWVNSNSTNYLYDLAMGDYGVSTRYSLMGNLDFDIRLNENFTFSSINNITWGNYVETKYTDPRSDSGSGVNGRLEEKSSNTTRRYTNQILRYNRNIGKHSISALVAYEFNDYTYKETGAIGTGFVAGLGALNATSIPEKTSGYTNTNAMQSYLFNANYAYDNKYLAQVSARRDGASNFGSKAKYGNFASISGGWLINRESFFKANWVDLLKVRVAYGTVGNRPTDNYPQFSLYSADKAASYNQKPGLSISQIGNDDLTWEKTATFGLGVDFNFLNRFRVSVDYYSKYTDNILFKVPVTGMIGVTDIWRNIGEMSNKGFEVVLGADIIKQKDWNWSVDFNIGFNQNKIEKLYSESSNTKGIISGISTIAGSINRILLPGYDMDTYCTREWAGVNPENGAPQWYMTTADGKREITSDYSKADETILSSKDTYTPDFFGGFSTDLRWKKLSLSAQFGYSVGGKIYNYARTEYDSDGAYTDRNQMKLQDGWSRWQKPGDIATHPVALYNNSSKSSLVSSRFLEDGSYLKLRTLTLGYDLELKRFRIPNIHLSLTAENLFTWTKYSGVDPEIPVRSDNGNVVGTSLPDQRPISRNFLFGLSFTL